VVSVWPKAEDARPLPNAKRSAVTATINFKRFVSLKVKTLLM
jgi:hypothetical protein